MFNPNKLAENIRICRKHLGMTQQALAEKLYVSPQAVSKWESGLSIPDLNNLCMLSDLFSVSTDRLLGITPASDAETVFIGIDGGATKTEFVLCNQNGHILKKLTLSGCNPNVCGMEETYRVLSAGIDSLLTHRPDAVGLFAGIAGFMSGKNGECITTFLKQNYPLLHICAGSDIQNVISSVPHIQTCVAVICGTGFAVYASDGTNLSRVGGWGYLLDDLGGFGLGRDALRASLAERDGFGKKTKITSLAEDMLGTSVWENMDKIYKGGDSYIASFAPVVLQAYRDGDSIATDILNEHTDAVLRHIDFASNTYGCGKDVLLSGGLLKEDSCLLELLCQKAEGKWNLIVPKLPQIFGACYRACSLFASPDADFEKQFQSDYI